MVGAKIGSYRIVRLVGEGGMGKVYEATHEQLGRRAAIKILRTEYARDPHMMARFLNEARAGGLVGHPGIGGVYEVGKLDGGAPYIVMEYLDGETLANRLARAGSLGSDAFRIGRQVASALAAVHEKGIIHRDLKPDNIMLVPDAEAPGGERAKVLDFGLAKLHWSQHAPRRPPPGSRPQNL
jgi:serine/threonine protein kinase